MEMPELSFAVGEEDVLVLEAEAQSIVFCTHQNPATATQAATAAEDAKDIELRNQRKVRMSRQTWLLVCCSFPFNSSMGIQGWTSRGRRAAFSKVLALEKGRSLKTCSILKQTKEEFRIHCLEAYAGAAPLCAAGGP